MYSIPGNGSFNNKAYGIYFENLSSYLSTTPAVNLIALEDYSGYTRNISAEEPENCSISSRYVIAVSMQAYPNMIGDCEGMKLIFRPEAVFNYSRYYEYSNNAGTNISVYLNTNWQR